MDGTIVSFFSFHLYYFLLVSYIIVSLENAIIFSAAQQTSPGNVDSIILQSKFMDLLHRHLRTQAPLSHNDSNHIHRVEQNFAFKRKAAACWLGKNSLSG